MRRLAARVLVFVLALALVGCGDGPEPTADSSPFTTRDSAGIEIVESLRPVWAPGEEWIIEEEPILAIGASEGEAPYLFSRVVGAFRLDDGRIVVGDAQSLEIRVFDREGRFMHAFGGRGEGPGELSRLRNVARYRGDSVVAVDGISREFEVFSTNGEHARTINGYRFVSRRPPPETNWSQSCCPFVGTLDDGAFVVAYPEASPARPASRVRGRSTVVLIPPDGSGLDTIGSYDGMEYFPDPGSPVGSQSVRYSGYFWPTTSATHVWVSNGSTYGPVQIDRSGRPVRIVRAALPRRATTTRFLDSLEVRNAARMDSLRAQGLVEESLFDPSPPQYADSLPAFDFIYHASGGGLWLRGQIDPLDTTGIGDYHVFDSRGRWLGTVEIDRAFFPLDIGPDWILGRTTDEYDVPRVELRRLVKPGGE